ncbi:peptidoglycan-binding protein [Streptomyces sp. NPDC051018]|uniref:peptidoglycan-binding protein n=1 Tax=Streptomyces sp. NPDC051018 TaxID=3365639 RepID=UPI0037A41249
MSEESMAGRRTGLSRRRRILACLVAGAIGTAGGGVGAAVFIKSPAQVAAETAAPAPDVLTAEVKRRVLAETLVTRGTVEAAQSVDVAAFGADKSAVRSVVTEVRTKRGAAVTFGQVLVEISGRPVIPLPGALPSYRDLGRGCRGKDVAQFQRALTKLGYFPGQDDFGVFGRGTERAAAAFYRSRGYEPLTAPVEDAAAFPAGGEAAGSPDPRAPVPETGVIVPAGELVYLRSGPVRTGEITASVGKEPDGKLLTLSAGTLMVRGSVAAHEVGLVHAGQKVSIFSETSGEEVPGSVLSVATEPSAKSAGEARQDFAGHTVRVKPDRALPESFTGQDVRLTIEAASSRSKVLAVPSAALSAGADGRTTVSVLEPGGSQERVEVRTGMSGNGLVQITPVPQARLSPGDRVVVGVGPAGGDDGTPR